MNANPPSSRRSPLYEGPYYDLRLDQQRAVLWLHRSSAPIERLGEVHAAQSAVLDRLEQIACRSFGLLVDLREAPSRNDPEFEEAVKEFRRQLFSSFPRNALLVRTAAGKMQLTRHVRSDGSVSLVKIFNDEAEAMEFLRGK